MSLIFKENALIVGRNIPQYKFENVSGIFYVNILRGFCTFDINVDGKKYSSVKPIIARNSTIVLKPLNNSSYYCFRLKSAFNLGNVDVLDTELLHKTYYTITDIDCNFKLVLKPFEPTHAFLQCGKHVLVDNDVSECEIDWSARDTSTLKLETLSGKPCPIFLRMIPWT